MTTNATLPAPVRSFMEHSKHHDITCESFFNYACNCSRNACKFSRKPIDLEEFNDAPIIKKALEDFRAEIPVRTVYQKQSLDGRSILVEYIEDGTVIWTVEYPPGSDHWILHSPMWMSGREITFP